MKDNNRTLGRQLREGFSNMIRIMFREFQLIFSDTGVLILILLPALLYPVLYSVIYGPEVIREMPIAVIDFSNSKESRDFLRKLDATPELAIAEHCISMEEAVSRFKSLEVRGIVVMPEDFSKQIALNRQATVSAYADMKFFLYYKALMTGIGYVTLDYGDNIQIARLQQLGKTEAEIRSAVRPVDIVSESTGNSAGGFASYSIPIALIMIIQQTLVLAIGIMAGTARERHQFHTLVSADKRRMGTFRIVIGKALAYFIIYALLSVYLVGFIPKWFGYAQMGSFIELAALITPFLLSSIFMGMALSVVFRDRESPIMLYVFTTFILLFLSGVAWPLSNFSPFWLYVREVFPSSNAIFGFVKMNTLGAGITETRHEIASLWIQAGVYFVLASIVYAVQVRFSEKVIRSPRLQKAILIRERLAQEES